LLVFRPTLERPAGPASGDAPAAVALLLLAAGFACCQPLSAAEAPAAPPPPPAKVFGALPENTDVVLSPNGELLAWADQTQVESHVVIFDVAARKELRELALLERLKLRGIFWSDDDTLLITSSETAQSTSVARNSREYYLHMAFDARDGATRMLPTPNSHATGLWAAALTRLVSVNAGKPHTVIMSSRQVCNSLQDCLLEVDTRTGNSTVLEMGKDHTVGWAIDRNGKPAAREDWDDRKQAYRLYALMANGRAREILRKDDSEAPRLAGLLPDASALVLLASNGHPHQAAWALPLDGSPARLLAEDPDADVTGTYTDSHTGAIVGVFIGGAETTVRWLDPQAQRRYEAVKRAFPDKQVFIYGWSSDDSRTLAEVQSATAPPVYYLVDFKTHHADTVAEEYPALQGVALGEFREINYKARDGTTIPAYLTMAPGKRQGPGPLVVLPHGGPNARDYPGFNWVVQFLATRGYSVLQPQFRGSTGFGEAFERAGFRQWGGLMQDDVTDGVRAMIDQGIADPHHVCIVGISYGGYAALAGATFTPSLYACAASINGVSDVRAWRQAQVPQSGWGRWVSASQSVVDERIGSAGDSRLDTRSPIHSIATIGIPVMIAYGSGDGVVPNAQSTSMAEALQKAGKSVTVVKLPDEDHWLSRAETRTQLLEALETFLKEHL
jgi:dipeptidyl aminopeptidase/acylaminoacyl peptidase